MAIIAEIIIYRKKNPARFGVVISSIFGSRVLLMAIVRLIAIVKDKVNPTNSFSLAFISISLF